MLNLDPEIDFEPSKNTKKLWKWVRHSSFQEAGITLPGLFEISHFPIDTFFFASVIGLELWGLANFLRVSQIELPMVTGLFAADLVCAVLAHLPRGGICLRRNKLVYEDSP